MAKKKRLPAKVKSQPSSRRRKAAQYRSFRLTKRIKHPAKITGSFRLFGRAVRILARHWKLFVGISLVYGLLNVFLVRGLGGSLDLTEIKSALNELFGGQLNQFASGITLFGVLLTTAGNTTSEVAGAYQAFLIIITSLALIWALRQIMADKTNQTFTVRDSFYKGIYPMVPFTLVLLVIGLQLLPLLIGSAIYSQVVDTGLAITAAEKIIWAVVYGLLALLSLYMITSSIFALYIVTLPDMTPLMALRSARQLVLHRRWTVLRKVIFLPMALLLLAAIITIPFIIFVTPLAEWLFFGLTIAALTVAHTYIYMLYRELL